MLVGIIGIRGLPAAYGAFDQCAAAVIETLKESDPHLIFCVKSIARTGPAIRNSENVNLFRFPQSKRAILMPLNYLINILIFYCNGCRTFLFFGHGAAIFFPFLRLLKCKIVCNTDGFEYKRLKWGLVARRYFLLTERLAALFSNSLVTDSKAIQSHFFHTYGKQSELIRYGSDRSYLCPHTEELRDKTVSSTSIEKSGYCLMRMEPENNIDLIVDAFVKLTKSGSSSLTLYIIGPATPWFNSAVLPRIRDCANIKFIGPIYDRLELNVIRDSMEFYIHGHSVGGTNPTLVESCDFNQARFVFDCEYSREVVGKNVVYFKDSDGLADALRKFELNPNRFHGNTVITLGPEYDWPNISRKYRKLITN